MSVCRRLGECAVEGLLETGANPSIRDQTSATNGLGVVLALTIPHLVDLTVSHDR